MIITSDYNGKINFEYEFNILVIGGSEEECKRIENLFYNNSLVLYAENKKAALDFLYSFKIDIVLINIISNSQNLLNLIYENNNVLSHIPTLIIADDTHNKYIDSALSLGAQDIITTSIPDNLLKKRITNAIAIKSNQNSLNFKGILNDDVTGLLTRFSFVTKVHDLVSNYPPNSFVLYAADIDGFKLINDRCGHIEGDRLLRHIADQHRNSELILSDYICRDMGDVFFSIAPYSKQQLNDTEITKFFNSIESYELPISVNIHIGKYIIDDPTLDVNLMMDRALIAVRSISGSASKHSIFFSEDMRNKLLFKQEIEDDMRSALIDKQFVLYFQPQYNYETKQMTGAEVLVRWHHPTKGILYPNDFIPLFEENGFISELDLYIWEQACKYLHDWANKDISPVSISVNISRQDIISLNIAEVIPKLTKKYGLMPSQLHLEITESAYLETPEKLVNAVTALQSIGYTIEMDDFGTGYSSINILKEVPVDVLKLDIRSLMDNNSKRSEKILSSVIQMAHWLELTVIAEGVETKEQAEYLKSMNCFQMQGYYFNKPMPVDNNFIEILRTAKYSN